MPEALNSLTQKSFLYKHIKVILACSALFVLGVLSTIIYQLKEHQLENHLALSKQIEQAENDFSDGLMHIALSGGENSPWQYKLGTILLRQSLSMYEQIADDLPGVRSSFDFLRATEELSSQLALLSQEERLFDVNLRQSIYEMRKQIDILERQLIQQLEQQQLSQSRLFASTVLGSLLVFASLLFALFRSERIRFKLDSHIRFNELRFSKLLQNTDEIFWLETYDNCQVVYISPAFEKLTSVPIRRVLNKQKAWRSLLRKSEQKALEIARNNAIYEVQEFDIKFRPTVASDPISLEGRVFPIWANEDDKTDEPEYIGAVLRDVTKKRDYERSLFQSQKMDSLGKLTGGVAHDFNNLLTVIMTNSELLLPKLVNMPALADTVNLIIRAAKRGASLNQQLLAFASKQQLHPEVISVNALVEDSVSLLSRTLGGNYHLNLQQDDDNLFVKVDPGQFQNVLVNLCINSRDAMDKGGNINLRTSKASADEEEALGNKAVKLIVKDNGCGIPQDVINRVFDPFFTTKTMDKGTGLGLSMVYGFVRQSGGRIHIDSKLGKGTTIHIVLPQHAPKEIAEQPTMKTIHLQQKLILLVEDDELVRESAAAALQSEGFRVLQAECAADAKLVLRSKSDIALVITDVVMPGEEDGYALVEFIADSYPTIKTLVISGFIGEERNHAPNTPFLQKPFSNEELLIQIQRLLV